jgi:hypothetical protein
LPSKPSWLAGSLKIRHDFVSSRGRQAYRPTEAARAALAKRGSATSLAVTTTMMGEIPVVLAHPEAASDHLIAGGHCGRAERI